MTRVPHDTSSTQHRQHERTFQRPARRSDARSFHQTGPPWPRTPLCHIPRIIKVARIRAAPSSNA